LLLLQLRQISHSFHHHEIFSFVALRFFNDCGYIRIFGLRACILRDDSGSGLWADARLWIDTKGQVSFLRRLGIFCLLLDPKLAFGYNYINLSSIDLGYSAGDLRAQDTAYPIASHNLIAFEERQ
jgi:hypothetical protein